MGKVTLYSYFRSSCSWRVRIALNLKQVDFDYVAVNLIKDGGEQLKEDYMALNPIGQVPSLIDEDGNTFGQSVAILEFLEEKYPEPSLLPGSLSNRAKIREIVELINSGTQPIQNLSVMRKVTEDPEGRIEWSRYWIEKGLRAVEKRLEKTAGTYCVGDDLTFADCCLVPQIYNANRFKVDLSQFPIINRIMSALEKHEDFKKAHPTKQPDCPPELR